MFDDDWVEVAMTDDSMVAEMLTKLRTKNPGPTLQLEWSVRQRRSRHLPRKKGGEMARASPTTPLSWSGGTSVSGGCAADGFEESSCPIEKPRNKVLVATETTTTKRSRRKKTLPELKEEESFLLKERRYLKNELLTYKLKLEKERAENEHLKRRKLELQSNWETGANNGFIAPNPAIPVQPQQKRVCCDNEKDLPLPNNNSKLEEVGIWEHSFFLPDLNILPFEDDLGFRARS